MSEKALSRHSYLVNLAAEWYRLTIVEQAAIPFLPMLYVVRIGLRKSVIVWAIIQAISLDTPLIFIYDLSRR